MKIIKNHIGGQSMINKDRVYEFIKEQVDVGTVDLVTAFGYEVQDTIEELENEDRIEFVPCGLGYIYQVK